jgi:hypothetical protein
VTLPPAIAATLAAENQRRCANWLGLSPDLCGSPTRPLTPRMVMELTLAGNAFFAARLPLWTDCHDVLWRLHPRYYRPASPARYFDWPAYANLARRLRRLRAIDDLDGTAAAIRAHIAAAYLDAPAAPAPGAETPGKPASPLAAAPHWLDALCNWVASRYGAAFGHPLDMPLAQIFQLRRAAGIDAGEDIIDPVAEQIGAALRPRPSAPKLPTPNS